MAAPAVLGGSRARPKRQVDGFRDLALTFARQTLLDPLVVQLAKASLAAFIVALGRAVMRNPLDPWIDGAIGACVFLAVGCLALLALSDTYVALRTKVFRMRGRSERIHVGAPPELPRLASVAPLAALSSPDSTIEADNPSSDRGG